jgi:hypothetical protein
MDVFARHNKMLMRVMAGAAPNCIPWWAKQPVDLFAWTMRDLEDLIMDARTSERAILVAFTFAERELEMLVRFHRKALVWFWQQDDKLSVHEALWPVEESDIEWTRTQYYQIKEKA